MTNGYIGFPLCLLLCDNTLLKILGLTRSRYYQFADIATYCLVSGSSILSRGRKGRAIGPSLLNDICILYILRVVAVSVLHLLMGSDIRPPISTSMPFQVVFAALSFESPSI